MAEEMIGLTVSVFAWDRFVDKVYDIYGLAENIAYDMFKADPDMAGIDKEQKVFGESVAIKRYGIDVKITYKNAIGVSMEKIYKVNSRKHQLIVP